VRQASAATTKMQEGRVNATKLLDTDRINVWDIDWK
jgi:hypothetical protein